MKIVLQGSLKDVAGILSKVDSNGVVNVTVEGDLNSSPLEEYTAKRNIKHISRVSHEVSHKENKEEKRRRLGSIGGAAYWAKFTPAERTKEIKRRQVVAQKNKLARLDKLA